MKQLCIQDINNKTRMENQRLLKRLFFLKRGLYGKIIWTAEALDFMNANYSKFTNPELAEILGEKLTSVRTRLYELGLKKQELEYWTSEMVEYLKENFRFKGDTEIAEDFGNMWIKEKGWSKKHIEKKRRYLNLKRTAEDKKFIFSRNLMLGRWSECAIKRWETTGQEPIGTIKYWKRSYGGDFPVIKTDEGFVHWGRYAWIQHYGSIEKGMNVVFSDGNNRNLSLNNLELVSDGELSRRNSEKASQGLSDAYVAGIMTHKNPELRKVLIMHPGIIELGRNRLKLNRTIKNENNGNNRN